jgi:RHS repeat-associated protein
VRQNGTVINTYTYDSNGNRLSKNSTTAIYDAQDRLTSYGTNTYSYTANGELTSKVNGAQTTSYQYDVLGNLVGATLPSGTNLNYIVDGQQRRIGKRVNGTLTQGFLYDGKLRIVAELDGSNAIVSRFVYGTKVNVPEYMLRGGVTYRLVTDHLGSVRLVVNTANGTVAQRIDYDEFGIVTSDTNAGFQPFGFAGGLYDNDLKLVRFGARDFDPETGRWIAKDPIKFNGEGPNLYSYLNNEPIEQNDPTGLWKGVFPGQGPDAHHNRNRLQDCPPKKPDQNSTCGKPEWKHDPDPPFHGDGNEGFRGQSDQNRGYQCIYDENGNLVKDGEFAGTFDYSPPVSWPGVNGKWENWRDWVWDNGWHFLLDMLPYLIFGN